MLALLFLGFALFGASIGVDRDRDEIHQSGEISSHAYQTGSYVDESLAMQQEYIPVSNSDRIRMKFESYRKQRKETER